MSCWAQNGRPPSPDITTNSKSNGTLLARTLVHQMDVERDANLLLIDAIEGIPRSLRSYRLDRYLQEA